MNHESSQRVNDDLRKEFINVYLCDHMKIGIAYESICWFRTSSLYCWTIFEKENTCSHKESYSRCSPNNPDWSFVSIITWLAWKSRRSFFTVSRHNDQSIIRISVSFKSIVSLINDLSGHNALVSANNRLKLNASIFHWWKIRRKISRLLHMIEQRERFGWDRARQAGYLLRTDRSMSLHMIDAFDWK